MVHRIRIKGDDGHDIKRDIDCGPGPVGLMPKSTINGWALTAIAQRHGDLRQSTGDSLRAQYLREYRARKRREAAAG